MVSVPVSRNENFCEKDENQQAPIILDEPLNFETTVYDDECIRHYYFTENRFRIFL